MTMFSIGALQALAACLSPACKWLAPHQRIQLLSIPHKWLPDSIPLYAILSNAVALATVVIWLAVRDQAWAWLLQDLLGICLIVLVLRQFRLPNLKVMASAGVQLVVHTHPCLGASCFMYALCHCLSGCFVTCPWLSHRGLTCA